MGRTVFPALYSHLSDEDGLPVEGFLEHCTGIKPKDVPGWDGDCFSSSWDLLEDLVEEKDIWAGLILYPHLGTEQHTLSAVCVYVWENQWMENVCCFLEYIEMIIVFRLENLNFVAYMIYFYLILLTTLLTAEATSENKHSVFCLVCIQGRIWISLFCRLETEHTAEVAPLRFCLFIFLCYFIINLVTHY